MAGIGIFVNYLAAEQARGGVIYNYGADFRVLARRSYAALDLAAVLYGVALGLLGITAGTRLWG